MRRTNREDCSRGTGTGGKEREITAVMASATRVSTHAGSQDSIINYKIRIIRTLDIKARYELNSRSERESPVGCEEKLRKGVSYAI